MAITAAALLRPNAEYIKYCPQWIENEDVVAGQDALKAKRERYLPRLNAAPQMDLLPKPLQEHFQRIKSMDDIKYANYIARAIFYGATGRTVHGLVGAVFRKPPVLEGVPDRIRDTLLKDADNAGTPFELLCRRVVEAVLTKGRHQVLVEANAERPYMVLYRAEDHLDWRSKVSEGRSLQSMAKLTETHDEPVDADGLDTRCEQWVRLLTLDNQNVYTVRRFLINADGKQFEAKAEVKPKMHTRPIKFIPLQVFGPIHNSLQVERSPIRDMVHVNLSHYLTSADLEWGRHFSALPTGVISSSTTNDYWPQGPSEIWILPPNSTWGKMDFAGSLQGLETGMEEKERKMALLGSRLLEEQKRAAEAAETARIRQGGEVATLSTVANAVSLGMTNVARWYVEWAGYESQAKTVTVRLNTDFVEAGLSPADAVSLMTVWQAGGMSLDTFLYNLKKGEILPPDRSIEDERRLIELQQPQQERIKVENTDDPDPDAGSGDPDNPDNPDPGEAE